MKILEWWMIIAILIGVAIAGGLLFGLMGELFGLSSGMRISGIGVIVGIAAAFLIARRRVANIEHKNR
jgi:dipeptide/tripeptide permease